MSHATSSRIRVISGKRGSPFLEIFSYENETTSPILGGCSGNFVGLLKPYPFGLQKNNDKFKSKKKKYRREILKAYEIYINSYVYERVHTNKMVLWDDSHVS
jgi:hypothetical protein